LPDLDYAGKRLALDMLDIMVYLDGENIEITGTIEPGIVLIPSSHATPPSGRYRNDGSGLKFIGGG